MKNDRIKIAVADDHPLIITGLKITLSDHPGIELFGAYSTGEALVAGIKIKRPDVLLLDIMLPDQTGDKIALLIKKLYPEVKILALTNFDSPAYLSSMLRNGADGYILKTTGQETLIKAIELVYAGKTFIEPSILKKMDLLKQRFGRTTGARIKLTEREKEVLPLIAEGCTDKEIAEKLFLSLHTAKNYRTNLLLKLDAKNTAVLIAKAVKMGLVE